MGHLYWVTWLVCVGTYTVSHGWYVWAPVLCHMIGTSAGSPILCHVVGTSAGSPVQCHVVGVSAGSPAAILGLCIGHLCFMT